MATCTNGMLNVDNAIDDATYTCDTVNSAEIIPANYTVTYESCKEIVLKPGFHAVAMSTFTARIIGCTPLTSPDNKVNQVRRNTQNITTSATVAMTIHPNPTRDFIRIDYQLKEAKMSSIGLFDITGQQLAVLSPKQLQDKGTYQKQVQLADFNAGIYFIVLQSEKEQISKKMILLR